MIDADSGKDNKCLVSADTSSIGKVELWTSLENVRLVAAITFTCNPISPDWKDVSELMKNQPDAKRRNLEFFSPENCCAQVQRIFNKYFYFRVGEGDIKYASILFYYRLINVLASKAHWEKSQQLRKNPVRQAITSSQSQNFTSQGSSGSTTSSTLDIIPDTIFEDAVQYESPAESLSDDYFRFSTMDKKSKPVLTGPDAIARKSIPKNVEGPGRRQGEIRHFTLVDLFGDANSTPSDIPLKNPPTRKNARSGILPQMPSTSTGSAISNKNQGGSSKGSLVSPSSSFRKNKANRISEISEKLAITAAATATASALPSSSEMGESAKGPQPQVKRKVYPKSCFLMGPLVPEGNKDVATLEKLQEQQSLRKEPRSSTRSTTAANQPVGISHFVRIQIPEQLPPSSMHHSTMAPLNRVPQFKKPRRLKKPAMSPKDDTSIYLASTGKQDSDIPKTDDLQNIDIQTILEQEGGGNINNVDVIRLEYETGQLSSPDLDNSIATAHELSPITPMIEDDDRPKTAQGETSFTPTPDCPVTETSIETVGDEIPGDVVGDITDAPEEGHVACIPEPEKNPDIMSDIGSSSSPKKPESSQPSGKQLPHGQGPPQNARVLRFLRSRTIEDVTDNQLVSRIVETRKTYKSKKSDNNDHGTSSSKLGEKQDTTSSGSASSSSNATTSPTDCSCQPHASHQVVVQSSSCSMHSLTQKSTEESEPGVETGPPPKPSNTVPQEELIFLFGQALAFSPEEFYFSSITGFPEGNNKAIKMPMDMLTILQMIKSGEIATVAALESKLTLAYTHAIFVHRDGHPIVKQAQFAVTSLRKLLSEYRSPEILHKRFCQFQKNGLVLLTPEEPDVEEVEVQVEDHVPKRKRPLSPDITDFPPRSKMAKTKNRKRKNRP